MNDEVGGINLSANATIEATYIIPIVIVIVCSFVYILFFSYEPPSYYFSTISKS